MAGSTAGSPLAYVFETAEVPLRLPELDEAGQGRAAGHLSRAATAPNASGEVVGFQRESKAVAAQLGRTRGVAGAGGADADRVAV